MSIRCHYQKVNTKDFVHTQCQITFSDSLFKNHILSSIIRREINYQEFRSMATLKDIANEAGVSTATVSRYLSNKITLLPETEIRLKQAIEKYHYKPNTIAKSLKQNRTQNIAVVLPRINNLFYSEVTAGINEILFRENYNLIIYEASTMKRTEAEILEILEANLVAGAIFAAFSHDTSFYETAPLLAEHGIPVVYVNRQLPYAGVPMVYPDFSLSSRMAAEHLIAQGKKRLAMIHSPYHAELLERNRNAFFEPSLSAGLSEPILISTGPETLPSTDCIRAIRDHKIDGIFALNEMMGSGLLRALSKDGCRIPEDIAVIAFGDSTISEVTYPSLSCIDLQNRELGNKSAELILSQIKKEEVPSVTVIEPAVKKREST